MWGFYGQKYVLIHIVWIDTFDSIYRQPYRNENIDIFDIPWYDTEP